MGSNAPGVNDKERLDACKPISEATQNLAHQWTSFRSFVWEHQRAALRPFGN